MVTFKQQETTEFKNGIKAAWEDDSFREIVSCEGVMSTISSSVSFMKEMRRLDRSLCLSFYHRRLDPKSSRDFVFLLVHLSFLVVQLFSLFLHFSLCLCLYFLFVCMMRRSNFARCRLNHSFIFCESPCS